VKSRQRVRHSFDIFADQLFSLRSIALTREQTFGKRVLLGDLVQQALGTALNRPAWARVPGFALSFMLGEMADMLLHGQRAVPKAALQLGYRFKYPKIAEALGALHL
jgi:hypothetical protein